MIQINEVSLLFSYTLVSQIVVIAVLSKMSLLHLCMAASLEEVR